MADALTAAYLAWDEKASRVPRRPAANFLEVEAKALATAARGAAESAGSTGSRLMDAIANVRRSGASRSEAPSIALAAVGAGATSAEEGTNG